MYLIFVALLGLSIGSFLNVLIDRLPKGESINGRSHCDYCGKTLGVANLIPVASFFMQKGKSACCNKPLSFQYSFIELYTAVVFVVLYKLLYLSTGNMYMFVGSLGVASSLIVITVADVKYHIIPDAILILLLASIFVKDMPWTVHQLLLRGTGGIALFVGMLGLFFATKGKGLGFGDVKFSFVIGFMMGLYSGFLALYISFMLGGITAIGMVLFMKKHLKTQVAFGPFMVAGVIIMFMFGPYIERLVNFLL